MVLASGLEKDNQVNWGENSLGYCNWREKGAGENWQWREMRWNALTDLYAFDIYR